MALLAQSVTTIDMLPRRHSRSATCAPNKPRQAGMLPARAQPATECEQRSAIGGPVSAALPLLRAHLLDLEASANIL